MGQVKPPFSRLRESFTSSPGHSFYCVCFCFPVKPEPKLFKIHSIKRARGRESSEIINCCFYLQGFNLQLSLLASVCLEATSQWKTGVSERVEPSDHHSVGWDHLKSYFPAICVIDRGVVLEVPAGRLRAIISAAGGAHANTPSHQTLTPF